jgi:hypothetical protein
MVLSAAKHEAERAEWHAAQARVLEANRAGYEVALLADVGFDTATTVPGLRSIRSRCSDPAPCPLRRS